MHDCRRVTAMHQARARMRYTLDCLMDTPALVPLFVLPIVYMHILRLAANTHTHTQTHLQSRLNDVLSTIAHLDRQEQVLGCYSGADTLCSPSGKHITRDSLVIGALQTAFVDMDEQIVEDKHAWRISGGCTGCVALFLLGKLYV
jgi:hypothetical protein